MGNTTLDFLIILILILINGFFAAAEIALISIRKGRIKALIEEGNARAKIISRLQGDPDRLFATVQVGVTLVGAIVGVFGGSSFKEKLEPLISQIPYPLIQNFSEQISFVIVVFFITYLSLVIGELVPKSLALNYSERVAMVVAYPLQVFNRMVYWFTRFLTFSSNLLLRPFKDRTSFSETRLLAEEIKHLLEEGVRHGTIAHSEHEIIENVLEINDTAAREVMVPRVDIKAISVDAAEDEVRKAVDSLYSRLPVFGEGLDNIIGILHMKDLMRCF